MAILVILEFVLAALVATFFVTQIFIPIARGTVLFPIFSKEHDLDKEIRKENQKIVEGDLEEKLKTIKEEPERRKNPKAFFRKKHFDQNENEKERE
jgi:hypothetical protein